MVIDGAAKASDSGAQLKCLNSLGALLMHPKLRPMSIPMVRLPYAALHLMFRMS